MEELIRSIAAMNAGKGRGISAGRTAGPSMPLLVSGAAMFLFAMLLGSYSPFEGVSPFGAAAVFAAWYMGLDPYSACLGAVLGYFLGGEPACAISCLALGFGIWAADTFIKPGRVYRLLLAFSASVVLNLVTGLVFRKNLLLFAASSTVSVLGAVVIGQGLRSLRGLAAGRALPDQDMLTLFALAGLVSLSFGRLSILGQSPAVIFSCLVSLFLSARLGMGAVGAAAAVGAGHALATGEDMHFIAVMAAVTLAASSFRGLGKWAVLAAFAGASCFITAFVGGNGVIGYIECGAACLLFALIPQRLLMRGGDTGLKTDPRLSRLSYRVAALSEVLSELSRVEGGDEGVLLGNIADSLRRSLNARSGTYKKRFEARCAGVSRGKQPGSPSGDSFLIREFEGKLLVALSDGMGSGERAKKESSAAVAMLSDLLKVGFTLEGAAECVNGSLARRGTGDMYATLDALLVDLEGGSALITKHGAPPSAVIRGGRTSLITAEALPVGIISGARGSKKALELSPGDFVVMMTDGVSDALEPALTGVLRELARGGDISPEELARALLNEALERGASDDATVVAVRMESVTRKSR